MDIMDIILKVFLVFLVVVLVLAVILLVYNTVIVIYRGTLEYETFSDTAMVSDMEYEDDYNTTTFVRSGKVTVPVTTYHDEEYNVYVTYEGEEYCLDDADLYEQVNIGDVIDVLVHKGYNKNGEVKHIYLSIED